MPYDNLVNRSNASVLVPREDFAEIMKAAEEQSAAMRLLRRVPVSTNQVRVPVLSVLPQAYWVNPTDTGLKQTSGTEWKDVYLNVEEAAVIIPMPKTVIDDVAAGRFNLTEEIKPGMAEAIGRLIDQAVFFGTSKPSSFPNGIATQATSAGNTYTRGTNAANKGGIAEDLNQLLSLIEQDGFAPDQSVHARGFKRFLRGARNAYGDKYGDISEQAYAGVPFNTCMDGLWPTGAGSAELIMFDSRKFLFGVRQDMEVTVHTEGVITDSEGAVKLNLMQQSAVALRATIRVGWASANPITRANESEEARFPAAVLLSPGANPEA